MLIDLVTFFGVSQAGHADAGQREDQQKFSQESAQRLTYRHVVSPDDRRACSSGDYIWCANGVFLPRSVSETHLVSSASANARHWLCHDGSACPACQAAVAIS